MAYYSYSNRFTLYSKGYTGENYGTIPAVDGWHDGSDEGGEQQATYYYSDSNNGTNANSSQVRIVIKDRWTARRLEDNTLEITLDTDIISICRVHHSGNPAIAHPEWWRTIGISSTLEESKAKNYIKKYPIWDITDYTCRDGVANIPTRKIYLPPGQETVVKNSMFIHNWIGTQANPDLYYQAPDVNSAYCDSMGCGVAFRNNLPREYPHRINYHVNGASDEDWSDFWKSVNQCENRTITSKVPHNPHWIFKGWSTDPDADTGNYYAGDTVNVCAQVDLYAIWEYTYRPGQCRHGNDWWSHDRDGVNGPIGRANVHRDGKWVEMRIRTSSQGLDDPPCIYQNSWRIQKLIGRDGAPHSIWWDCPHEWDG